MNAQTQGALETLGQTDRIDSWWIESALIALGLILFILYGMYTTFQPISLYEWGPYVSPFRSPILHFIPKGSVDFSGLLGQALILIPLSIPLGFRATCYYFRKAYYRAFLFSPPACAVGKATPENYKGETAFPFIFQNLHRYFFYFAVGLVILHWIDTTYAFIYNGGFYMGVGSILLLLDAVFLSLYVFSCHSWRHLFGGKLDCFSCSMNNQVRYTGWKRISKLNENHAIWAWVSMLTIVIADLYVRLVSSGVLTDIKILGA